MSATGVDLIAAERQRQIDAEGWTAEHDAEHTDGELMLAAQGYLVAVNDIKLGRQRLHPGRR